jgi:hypothetical protein
MLCVDITSNMIVEAESMSKKLGVLNNSIRKGEGNLAGFLGELSFLKAFPKTQKIDSYNFDIKVGNYSVEIKTKDRTVPPQLYYEASIANYNTRQKADYYVFISLLREGKSYKKAFIMGFIEPNEYMGKSIFLKKGQVDPSNNWTVNADCWNLPYSKLNKFNKL